MKKFLLLIASIFMLSSAVYAGSGVIQFTDHKSITRGNSVTVTLKVKSNDVSLKEAEMDLTYDIRALEFESGSVGVEGGDGFIKITGKGKGNATKTLEYTMKFKTLLAGTHYVNCTSNKVTDRNDNTVNITTVGQSKIVVTARNRSSRNASLKALAISPGELDKEFSSEELNYKAEVNADTESIQVFPIPEDDDASYTITGNTQIVNGPNNNITIVVTAPNGSTKKTYTIAVEKLDYGVSVGGNMVSGAKITSQPLTITVREKPDEIAIPDGFVEGTLIIGATQVNGFIPAGENNEEVMYGLIYADRNGEEDFYKYDKNDGSLQRFVPDPNTSKLEETQRKLKKADTQYLDLMKRFNILLPVAIGLGVLVLVLIILLIIGSKGKGGKGNRFEDDYDDDDDDYFIRKPERKQISDDVDYDDIDDDDIEDLG